MHDLQFSRDHARNYDRHAKRYGAEFTPCFLCGRHVDTHKTHATIHVHDGGFVAVTEDEAERLNDAGDADADMGRFPVGPECAKQPGLAPYLTIIMTRTREVWS